MKALWCGATALTLVAAVSLSPAMAQGPKPSGGNTWPGISQRVDHGSSTIAASLTRAQGPKLSGGSTRPGISQRVDHSTSTVAASPAVPGPRANGRNIAPGSLDLPADPGAAAVISHYEWQYHYGSPCPLGRAMGSRHVTDG